MEEKDIKVMLEDLKKSLSDTLTKEAKAEFEKQIKALEDKLTALDQTETVKELQEEIKALKEAAAANQPVIDAFVNSKNDKNAPVKENKSFNEIIGDALMEFKGKIQSSAPGQYSESNPLRISLLPEFKAEGSDPFQVKTVGDMSISANFPSSTNWTTDVRNDMIPKPYDRTWLADLLPQGTGTGLSILYPKENGGEGGVATWTDPTQDKAQADFDFTTYQAYFKWGAGWVIIDRDMMDNFSWMVSYIQQKLLVSLKTWENNFVLNGTSDTNPVQGLIAASTPYNGNYSTNVDEIVDAAFGQIVEDTFNYYVGNLAIMGPRASVGITLNKSGTSDEYDLPSGTSPFRSNSLALNALQIVPVVNSQLRNVHSLILDKSATAFVRRIQPELRMFEDSTLAKKNKVMFRIEEKATLAIFNNKAIVEATLATS